MRPRLRDGVALRLALQPVVTDGGGCGKALLDVARLEEVLVAIGVVSPDAGQAVRLELEPHGQRVGLLLRRRAARRAHFVGDAEQVLHVVTDLVRDHVRLREIARRAEPPLELSEERQVDVHLAVRRAVERPDRRRVESARRGDLVREQHQRRQLILAPHARQLRTPDVLGRRQDGGRKAAELVFGRPMTSLAATVDRHLRRPGDDLQKLEGVLSRQHGDCEQQQQSPAAERDAAAADG